MKLSQVRDLMIDFCLFVAIAVAALGVDLAFVAYLFHRFHWYSLWPYHFVGLIFVPIPVYAFGTGLYLPRSAARAIGKIRLLDPTQIPLEIDRAHPDQKVLTDYFARARKEDSAELRSIKRIEYAKRSFHTTFSFLLYWFLSTEGILALAAISLWLARNVPSGVTSLETLLGSANQVFFGS